MNLDQGIVFAVLGMTLALFIWNRLRFDVVSMLAFGSLLGGTVTLIGTPPNIIISSYRPEGDLQLMEVVICKRP